MWTNFTTDFNQDEETANFGTRLAVEAKGNLYDVVTFALFEPSEVKLIFSQTSELLRDSLLFRFQARDPQIHLCPAILILHQLWRYRWTPVCTSPSLTQSPDRPSPSPLSSQPAWTLWSGPSARILPWPDSVPDRSKCCTFQQRDLCRR